MINVLVVDDSVFMRKAIMSILEKDPEIKIVGQARNGEEAVELCRTLDPDVMTLDVEMPRMGGLEVLKIVMAQNPCPILMVSSLTTEGAETTLKALELGALDFIPKTITAAPVDLARLETELREKVKAVARRKRFMRRPRTSAVARETRPTMPTNFSASASKFSTPVSSAAPAAAAPAFSGTGSDSAPAIIALRAGKPVRDLVAIGVSTGGPPAVQKVLSALAANFPVPILIAQHMPASFTGPFAKRLDNICQLTVKEAEDGDRLRPGHVYISPGGKHIRLESKFGASALTVTPDPKDALYKPSANVLMESVGNALGRRALGVILTGMGNDGLEGIKVLKQKGGKTLAQSEATCVVYGMPKAIVDAGLADEIIDIDNMAEAIVSSLYR